MTIVAPLVCGWRWRLVGAAGPPMQVAVRVGDAARGCLIKTAKRLTGSHLLPTCLHGDVQAPDARHTHAFYLPEDLDGDGRIDHLLVFASGGIDRQALVLLAGCESLFLGQLGEWSLSPCWMGPVPQERCYRPSRIWRSLTPYCPPWQIDHSGRPREPTMQIRREAERRGLPAIIAVETLDVPGADHFVVERSRQGGPPNEQRRAGQGQDGQLPRCFLRLHFAEPVGGPLSFGFNNHFGLGQFVAAEPFVELRSAIRSVEARQNCPDRTDPTNHDKPPAVVVLADGLS